MLNTIISFKWKNIPLYCYRNYIMEVLIFYLISIQSRYAFLDFELFYQKDKCTGIW